MSGASLLDHFRRRYGASPLHLAGHLVVFAIAAFAIDRIASASGLAEVIGLFVGFVIAHDLVFLPFYSWLDRVMRRVLARLSARWPTKVPVTNHVRAPLFLSGLLLVTYLPLISGRADSAYFAESGHHLEGYVRNWVLISVVLFLASGLIYAVRVLRARARADT
jgi:hypothetical protein